MHEKIARLPCDCAQDKLPLTLPSEFILREVAGQGARERPQREALFCNAFMRLSCSLLFFVLI
jgi:hypothetical protein